MSVPFNLAGMTNTPALVDPNAAPFSGPTSGAGAMASPLLASLLDHAGVPDHPDPIHRLAQVGAAALAHGMMQGGPTVDQPAYTGNPSAGPTLPSPGTAYVPWMDNAAAPATPAPAPSSAAPATPAPVAASSPASPTSPGGKFGPFDVGPSSGEYDTDPNSPTFGMKVDSHGYLAGGTSEDEGKPNPADLTPLDTIVGHMTRAGELERQAAAMVAPTPPTGIMDLKKGILTSLMAGIAQKFGGKFSNAGDTIVNGAMAGNAAKQKAQYDALMNQHQAAQRDLMAQAEAEKAKANTLIGNNQALREQAEKLYQAKMGYYGKVNPATIRANAAVTVGAGHDAERALASGNRLAAVKYTVDAANNRFNSKMATQQEGQAMSIIKGGANVNPGMIAQAYKALRQIPGSPYGATDNDGNYLLSDDDIQSIADKQTPGALAASALGDQRTSTAKRLDAITKAYPALSASQIAANYARAQAVVENANTNQQVALDKSDMNQFKMMKDGLSAYQQGLQQTIISANKSKAAMPFGDPRIAQYDQQIADATKAMAENAQQSKMFTQAQAAGIDQQAIAAKQKIMAGTKDPAKIQAGFAAIDAEATRQKNALLPVVAPSVGTSKIAPTVKK